MKIVIATAVYYPMTNGVAVFSHNLAVGLARRGHDVMVLCPSQTGKNHTLVMDGVKVVYLKSIQAKVYPDQIHPVPKKKRLFYRHGFRVSVFPQREIRKALDKFKPDNDYSCHICHIKNENKIYYCNQCNINNK